MTMRNAVNMNTAPMMDSFFYYFTMVRFFAGLFVVPKNKFCQIHT